MTKHTRTARDDSGFTLIEIMVGMSIMSIFLAIFGGSMINMFKSVNSTQQTAFAQSAVNQAFIKLENQIRYASGISTPATNVFATGDAVVEWSTDHTGEMVCSQLRVSPAGTLQQRSWVQPDNGSSLVMGTSVVLATNMDPDTPKATASADVLVAGPFAMFKATGFSNTQRLEIAMSASDTALNARERHVDVTFSALNTGTSTESSSVCSAGRDKAKYPWPANS